MTILNLGLRFLLELGGVAALGYWGFAASPGTLEGAALGLGAPVVLVATWGLVVAPRATNRLGQSQRSLVGTVLLLFTAVALATAGQPAAGLWLGGLVVLNAGLLARLGDRAVTGRATAAGLGR